MASKNETYEGISEDDLIMLAEEAIAQGDEDLAIEIMEQINGVDFDVMEMLGNVPSSGIQYGADMAEGLAAMSPISPTDGLRVPPAVESLGMLGSGIAQNVAPDFFNEKTGFDPNSKVAADAMGDYYSDRYGGWDNAKRTLMDDPVGTLSDLSLPLTLGSSALVSATKGMSKANKIANLLKNTSQSLDPIGAIQTATAKPLYKAGARPIVAKEVDRAGDINRVLDKGFEYDIPINQKGSGKLAEKVSTDMNTRNAMLQEIPGEFSAGKVLQPEARFLDDMFDADSGTRGATTVDQARRKVARVIGEETNDALSKGPLRNAEGLNAMKTRQMKVANTLKGYDPDSNKNVEALTHRNLGSKIKTQLEGLAEEGGAGRGAELSGLNENYADLSAMGRALDDNLGTSTPGFNIDYSVRSAAGAMGATPAQAVSLGSLLGNTVGPRAANLGLAMKLTPQKQALVSVLRQQGRTEQEIEDALYELGDQ